MKLKIKDISKAAEKNKPIGKNLRRRCCFGETDSRSLRYLNFP